ncbi:MAG: group II intron [Geobacteraceae bacterium]|nr:MAG: group II intron [Geobacteraceae bacterium]
MASRSGKITAPFFSRTSSGDSGPWAMSRRLAAHTGMTNKCLKDQGLVSVKELWVKIHGPVKARPLC